MFCKNCGAGFPENAAVCPKCGVAIDEGNTSYSKKKRVTFTEAVSTCFAKYATFKGRAGRAEYEYWYMFLWSSYLLYLVLTTASGLFVNDESNEPFISIASLVYCIFGLGMILPSFAVSVRRLHDMGKNGWWSLILFIPLFGAILWSILILYDGDQHTNKYDIE